MKKKNYNKRLTHCNHNSFQSELIFNSTSTQMGYFLQYYISSLFLSDERHNSNAVRSQNRSIIVLRSFSVVVDAVFCFSFRVCARALFNHFPCHTVQFLLHHKLKHYFSLKFGYLIRCKRQQSVMV